MAGSCHLGSGLAYPCVLSNSLSAEGILISQEGQGSNGWEQPSRDGHPDHFEFVCHDSRCPEWRGRKIHIQPISMAGCMVSDTQLQNHMTDSAECLVSNP